MSEHFASLATDGVRLLQPYQPGKPIEELERELGISNTLKLASNENPLGPGRRAVEAMRAQVEGVGFYPDGNGFELKQALAARHSVAPESITLGNGSNDVLELAGRAFLNSDTNAVYSQHSFAVYPLVTQAVGAEHRVASANPVDHAMPYGHDLEAMSKLVNNQTRVVFVGNPNNPTGTWLKERELRAFIASLPQSTIVIVDEAYCEYVQESEYPDAVSWLDDFPNLVVTRTFSKIHGLAGLRVGYGFSHPEVADLLNRVRQPFNVNSIALAAATAALGDEVHICNSVEVNAAGLKTLAAACDERGLSYIPSVGNFLAIDFGRPAALIYEALLREAVIVRPIANYKLPNHLRVTVGRPHENEKVIQALDKVLA